MKCENCGVEIAEEESCKLQDGGYLCVDCFGFDELDDFEDGEDERQAVSEVCTCLEDGSFFCKFPHPCRRCFEYHPGVSCYWHAQGKTPEDKRPGGRTFALSNGGVGCDECCNGDRCDDRTHRDRDSCPYCLGSNQPIAGS